MPKHEIMFIISSYLLGSIPFGYILFYLTERKDIRQEGSGNIGATNVLRTKGKSAGILTLVLDACKGILPVLYGMKHFDSPLIIIAGGAAVVLGHLFPLYIKFKGGKGIASFLGVFIVFHFPAALAFGAAFLVTFAMTRYVSASSIAAVIAVFFFTLFTQVVSVSMVVFAVTVLIILKHHDNIRRIAAGNENQLIWKNNG
jgi:glycerol-3-phosphate acyltransferase PlsY